jgi:hypothetical protein
MRAAVRASLGEDGEEASQPPVHAAARCHGPRSVQRSAWAAEARGPLSAGGRLLEWRSTLNKERKKKEIECKL